MFSFWSCLNFFIFITFIFILFFDIFKGAMHFLFKAKIRFQCVIKIKVINLTKLLIIFRDLRVWIVGIMSVGDIQGWKWIWLGRDGFFRYSTEFLGILTISFSFFSRSSPSKNPFALRILSQSSSDILNKSPHKKLLNYPTSFLAGPCQTLLK